MKYWQSTLEIPLVTYTLKNLNVATNWHQKSSISQIGSYCLKKSKLLGPCIHLCLSKLVASIHMHSNGYILSCGYLKIYFVDISTAPLRITWLY